MHWPHVYNWFCLLRMVGNEASLHVVKCLVVLLYLWCCACSCHRHLLLLDNAHLVGRQLGHRNDRRGRGCNTDKVGSS